MPFITVCSFVISLLINIEVNIHIIRPLNFIHLPVSSVMTSITFIFDKSDRKYNPGDIIHCTVQVNVSTKFKARSLSVRFKGVAHTQWRKSRLVNRNGKLHTVYDRYTGDEQYFRHYQYVLGNQGANEREVPVGIYSYDVPFTLPANLPSSLEHTNGYIRYTVKASYDVSWGFKKESTVSLFVTSGVDLNKFPHLRDPVRQTKEKTLSSCCWKSDPMQLVKVLPKTGFVPGETIPITIEIKNNSNDHIDYLRVQLKEKLTFTARHLFKTDKRSKTTTLKEQCFRTPVAPFQNKQFQSEFYLDPSYDWKLFNGCGIIHGEYYIKTEAVASITTMITIGLIPFIEIHTNGPVPTAPVIFNPTAPIDGVIVEQPLPAYHEVAPKPKGTSPIGSSGNSGDIGWNLESSSSGVPLASTHLSPPSFEDSQKNPVDVPADKMKEIEAEDASPSAPPEPTAPPNST